MLYEVCQNKNSSVYEVASDERVLRFKVRLQCVLCKQWYDLASRLNRVQLSHEKDKVLWKWTASKKFSIKYVYNFPTSEDSCPSYA
jgi:hypothetical protein